MRTPGRKGQKAEGQGFLSPLHRDVRFKWVLAMYAVVCGLFAGVLVVLYRQGIGYCTELARRVYGVIADRPLLILPWLVIALVVGLLVSWLVCKVPMASGSGIPQVEGVVIWGMKMKASAVLMVRYLGGLACSLFGLSLGREGPSIQIGAVAGQLVSKGGKGGRARENYLITAGAAAGLSAAFNAPLSGMVFALEEVHRSFSPVILLSAAAASLSADFVSKNWFGLRPVLDFTAMPQLSISEYFLMIPLGLVAGLIGSLMNRLLLFSQKIYGRIPSWAALVLALLCALPVGLFFPQALGGGENLIGQAERVKTVTLTVAVNLLLLLLVKIVFTATSFGSGAPGGIFMPILAVGTLTGSLFGMGMTLFGVSGRIIPVCAACAMAATLTASVKAPVTSILLTVEMSGTLIHMLPVALSAFTALMVSDLLHTRPIYQALLDRYSSQNQLFPSPSLGTVSMEFVVEYGSKAAGQLIGHLDWPGQCALVGLHRGEQVLAPTPLTRLLAGDYLYVQCQYDNLQTVRTVIDKLCQQVS